MQSGIRRGLFAVLSVMSILLGITAVASADDVSNNLDNSIDATAEIMSLNVGGPAGTTTLYITPRNGDGKSGCNLTGGTTLTISLSSSNTAVATVSPSSVTFTACGDTRVLTVTPVSQGSATVSAALVSNNTGGTFNLAPVTFIANVTPPPNTAPTVTVAGVTGGASYPLGSVPAATCNVTDAEDGPSSFAAALSAITGPDAANGIGSQTATCSYTDAGGLNATSSVTYAIIDVTAPAITSTLSPASPNGANGWYTSDVTLDWTVTEAESTSTLVKSGCDSTTVTADQQSVDYTCSATSAGGSASATESIKRDATKPTIGAALSPATNSNGWNNTNVSVTYTCDDATSGVAGCGPNQMLSTEGSAVAYSGTATDNAGNTESVGGTVKIDKTPPVVAVTGVSGGPFTLGAVPAAGCSTTDAISGVATQASLSTTGGPVGSITATCSGATDNAGNAAASVSATYSVIYNWSGFRQPVDNMPVLNKAKAGSAIPVKFSLSGNQGLNIFAAGFPKSAVGSCDPHAVAEPIEETVTAGSSSLTYDATADQYTYVWKTDKAWTGCRTLTLKFVDGKSYHANFNFTK